MQPRPRSVPPTVRPWWTRPSSVRCTRATSCSCTRGQRSPSPRRRPVPEETDFLYPFIEGDERDADALLADLGRSAVAKAEVSARLRSATLTRARADLDAAATAMAGAFAGGGRLF